MLTGAPLSMATDVYSFGMVMWEVLTRRVPYDKYLGNRVLIAKAVLQGHSPRWPKKTPKMYSKLGRMCLDPNPDQRPAMPTIVNELYKVKAGNRGVLRSWGVTRCRA